MTFARHAVLLVPLFAATLFVGRFLVMMVEWGLSDGEPTVLALSLVVVLGAAWTTIRAAGSYRRSLQRASRN